MRYSFNFRVLFICAIFVSSVSHALQLQTLYGDYEVVEPVIQELLVTSAVQRLHHIQQYGVEHYVRKKMLPYSRYEHSVGVMVLLKRFGASVQEQVAGLLHDVSHTVFSHVGDHVMALQHAKEFDQNDEAYQDNVHTWYLAQTDVKGVLDTYGIAVKSMDPKCGQYQMLEQELPDICADRLEYNLYGGYIEGLVAEDEVRAIIASLEYRQKRWFFDDLHQAKKFAEISLWLTEHRFASLWNFVTYDLAAKALVRAVDLGLLTMHDIHFSVDEDAWNLLCNASDEIIQKNMRSLVRYKDAYEEVGKGEKYDASFVGKFRGVDPWVQVGDTFKRLSDMDDLFRTECERAKAAVTKPRYIRYTKS